ncbi:hypothetical protein CRG98_049011, partial [Punica granatum]
KPKRKGRGSGGGAVAPDPGRSLSAAGAGASRVCVSDKERIASRRRPWRRMNQLRISGFRADRKGR